MSAADWLVAMDDAFTVRLTHCTVCGRRAASVYFDIWAAAALQQAIGLAVCPSCPVGTAWRQAVEDIMQERYGAGRQEASSHVA